MGVATLSLALTLAFAEMGVLTFTETGAGVENTGVAIETVLEMSIAKTL